MKQYYIILNDQQAGPYTIEELTTISVTPDTMVWCEGMEDWAPARQVSELSDLWLSAQETPQYTPPTYGVPPTAPRDNRSNQYHRASPYSSTTEQQPMMPPTYLAWSIAVTLLCCLVGGIVAIVYSTQVSPRYMQGDYEGAEASSRKARLWIIISAIVGFFVAFGWIIWTLFFAAAGAFSSCGDYYV